MANKTYILKLTSAIAIAGVISKAGDLVEVSELESKNFLARGKAVLATAEDGVDEEQTEPNNGDDLSKLTKEQLLAKAGELGAEIGSGATKAQIIEAIAAKATGEKEGE